MAQAKKSPKGNSSRDEDNPSDVYLDNPLDVWVYVIGLDKK